MIEINGEKKICVFVTIPKNTNDTFIHYSYYYSFHVVVFFRKKPSLKSKKKSLTLII